jgi:hypothetical protein
MTVLVLASCGTKANFGACDARPGPPDGVAADAAEQGYEDQCVEFADTDLPNDMAAECQAGKFTRLIGTWHEGARCAPGTLLATCRIPYGDGTETTYYYEGYPFDALPTAQSNCKSNPEGSVAGVWCVGSTCP